MNIFAYCAASFQQSVKKAAGVQPMLSPPVTMKSFHPALFDGRDFIYIKLHGLPDERYWYGDNWITAVSLDQIQQTVLVNTVVFLANCHALTRDGEPAPMTKALLDAGAVAVVAGAGENYAKRRALHSADVLGLYFRRCLLNFHLSPQTALKLARIPLKAQLTRKLDAETEAEIRDALAFQLLERKMQ